MKALTPHIYHVANLGAKPIGASASRRAWVWATTCAARWSRAASDPSTNPVFQASCRVPRTACWSSRIACSAPATSSTVNVPALARTSSVIRFRSDSESAAVRSAPSTILPAVRIASSTVGAALISVRISGVGWAEGVSVGLLNVPPIAPTPPPSNRPHRRSVYIVPGGVVPGQCLASTKPLNPGLKGPGSRLRAASSKPSGGQPERFC